MNKKEKEKEIENENEKGIQRETDSRNKAYRIGTGSTDKTTPERQRSVFMRLFWLISRWFLICA